MFICCVAMGFLCLAFTQEWAYLAGWLCLGIVLGMTGKGNDNE